MRRNRLRLEPSVDGWLGRVFRLLLLVYPREFREAFGEEIEQTFADLYRDACGETPYKRAARRRLWIHTISDLMVNALAERIKDMNRPRLLLFLLAATAGFLIAYIDSRPHWDDTGITVAALVLSSFLLGAVSPPRPGFGLSRLVFGFRSPVSFFDTTLPC